MLFSDGLTLGHPRECVLGRTSGEAKHSLELEGVGILLALPIRIVPCAVFLGQGAPPTGRRTPPGASGRSRTERIGTRAARVVTTIRRMIMVCHSRVTALGLYH
jgi:hypothetical protein